MPPNPSAERLYYEQLERACESVIRIFEQGSGKARENLRERPAHGDLLNYQKSLTQQMGSLDKNLRKLIGERPGEQ